MNLLRYKALRLFAEMKREIEKESADGKLNWLLTQSCTLKVIDLMKKENGQAFKLVKRSDSNRISVYTRIAELSEMEEIIKAL
jgi:hypothetical protein